MRVRGIGVRVRAVRVRGMGVRDRLVRGGQWCSSGHGP